MFPTWPAKSEMAKRPKKKDVEHSPQAPQGGAMFAKLVSRMRGAEVGGFMKAGSFPNDVKFCVISLNIHVALWNSTNIIFSKCPAAKTVSGESC